MSKNFIFILLLSFQTHSKEFFGYLREKQFEKIQEKVSYKTLFPSKYPNIIISHDEQNFLWDNSPILEKKFQKHLDYITQSSLTGGNKAKLLISGMMSYKARYALIDEAKSSIIITALSISAKGGLYGPMKDQAVIKLFQKLKEAILIRKVKVYILYDGLSGTFEGTQKFVDELRSLGALVIKYNPLYNQERDLAPIYPLNYLQFISKLFYKTKTKGPDLFRNRWHHKIFLIDEKFAIVGGLNMGEQYAYGSQFIENDYSYDDFIKNELIQEIKIPYEGDWGTLEADSWRDNDVLLKGPIVEKIKEKILEDIFQLEKSMNENEGFESWKNISLKNQDESFVENHLELEEMIIRPLSQRPFFHLNSSLYTKDIPLYAKNNNMYYLEERPSAVLTHFFVNVINRAQKQILWGGFTLGPKRDIFLALQRGASRGVKIYLMTNSKETSRFLDDFGITSYMRNKRIYGPLIKAGKNNIRIFEWQRNIKREGKKLKSGAFHSKNMSIDGILTFVGSYNMSGSSYMNFAEGGVAIFDKSFTKSHQEMFQNDLKYTKEVFLRD